VRVRQLIDKMEEAIPSAQDNKCLQIAREVDRVASSDEYFTSRNLCANTDLYVSFVYTALGIPPSHVLSMIMASRMVGMLAHWREAMGKSVHNERLWGAIVYTWLTTESIRL
jgi:citrate synthase